AEAAAVSLDDRIGDGKAEARPLSRRLRGEERLEHALAYGARDARTRIFDADVVGAVASFRAHHDRSAFLDGVEGVRQDVEERLVQKARIAVEPIGSLELQLQGDSMLDAVTEDRHHGVQIFPKAHHLALALVQPRKGS